MRPEPSIRARAARGRDRPVRDPAGRHRRRLRGRSRRRGGDDAEPGPGRRHGRGPAVGLGLGHPQRGRVRQARRRVERRHRRRDRRVRPADRDARRRDARSAWCGPARSGRDGPPDPGASRRGVRHDRCRRRVRRRVRLRPGPRSRRDRRRPTGRPLRVGQRAATRDAAVVPARGGAGRVPRGSLRRAPELVGRGLRPCRSGTTARRSGDPATR